MMSSSELNLLQIFLKGGPIMWPILLCSVLSLSIALERCSFYFSGSEDIGVLRLRIFEALKREDRADALKACDSSRSVAGPVFKAGLLVEGDRQQIIQAMEKAAQEEVPRLEQWLPALMVIANVSPLLGFLGTALGLASSFLGVKASAAAMNPAVMGYFSSGIAQALLTTIAGLLVGISASLVYNGSVIWVNHVVRKLEREAEELAEFLAYFSESAFSQDGGSELTQEP